MTAYEQTARSELIVWLQQMQHKPTLMNRATAYTQRQINQLIPEKVHQVVTKAIQQMTRAVIAGSGFTTRYNWNPDLSFEATEARVLQRINIYKKSAAAEGAATGAGGFLLGLADFPLWLSLKMKMLFDVCALYGYDFKDLQERIYLLYIFHLTFSPQRRKNQLIGHLMDWEQHKKELPTEINTFDWRTFQLEYRDKIDLAKLFQLIPGFGAAVGLVVNHQLTGKLGVNAMQAFRLRIFKNTGDL